MKNITTTTNSVNNYNPDQTNFRPHKSLIKQDIIMMSYPVKEFEALIKKQNKIHKRMEAHQELVKTGYMTKLEMDKMKADIAKSRVLRIKIYQFVQKYNIDWALVKRFMNKDEEVDDKNITPPVEKESSPTVIADM